MLTTSWRFKKISEDKEEDKDSNDGMDTTGINEVTSIITLLEAEQMSRKI